MATPRKKTTHAPVLFTGFPGFIGARLLPRLLELDPTVSFTCLVQEKFQDAAERSIADLAERFPHTRSRISTVTGDITQPGLGIEAKEAKKLQANMVAAYHLAAVYDLAVRRDVGMRINVEGTRNVLDFLQECKKLKRHHYVSTCYVSGTAVGVYRESDLDVGQSFKNYYEETKFLAEVDVAEAAQGGLPTTIYRPSIVVGDSHTGETAKFDGPYFTLTAMEKMPNTGAFIKIGFGANQVNLVPVDFVVEALAQLSLQESSAGKTYHLADPQPCTVLEVAELFERAIGKSFVYLPVPLAIAKAIFAPGFVQGFFGMPQQSLDYFDHPVRYDASESTRDLKALGVECPRFRDYVQRLVAFYRKKKGSVRRSAMI